jgi:hypothetical protein
MKGPYASVPASSRRTMLGCPTAETALTSWRKRPVTSVEVAYSGLMSFTATRSPLWSVSASKTAPIPPSPIMRRMR